MIWCAICLVKITLRRTNSIVIEQVKVKVTPMACLCRYRGYDGGIAPTHPQPVLEGRFTPGRGRCAGGWVGVRSSLDGTKNLATTEIRSPDCQIVARQFFAFQLLSFKMAGECESKTKLINTDPLLPLPPFFQCN
jgi:hypothetical protein